MRSQHDCHTLIVGGGLAGLACAQVLQEAGVDWLLVEKNEALGGRVQTRMVDGFRLDRGFQVLNTAYPALHRVVDLNLLKLGEFSAGAEVHLRGRFYRVGDPLRQPGDLLPTLLAPVGGLGDKLNILRLSHFCRNPVNLESVSGLTAEEFLVHFGFSREMIEKFFRPFFGGVFLEEELLTSARKLVTLFSYFSRGRAALPAQGMQALPELMAARLPEERIKLGVTAEVCENGVVQTQNFRVRARHLVLAGWESQHRLLDLPQPRTHSAHTVSFSSSSLSQRGKTYLKLNGSPQGRVQTLAINSAAQPAYAPPGKDLIVVSTRGVVSPGQLKEELIPWFGDAVKDWTHLRTDHVKAALPQEPDRLSGGSHRVHQGLEVHCCGDHTESGSIQGALTSGRRSGFAVTGFIESSFST